MIIIKCIYCDKTDLSESHIIPDALSNGSMKNSNVCKEDNSKCSDRFETAIIHDLGFLTNSLDIKSRKSKQYASFTVEFHWNGNKYIDTKYSKLSLTLDKVLTAEGNENLKIAPSFMDEKLKNAKNIEFVTPNDQKLTPHIHFNINVFFCKEMKRLISKMAYEWFCSVNKIENKPAFATEMIDFIINGAGEGEVDFIINEDVQKGFRNLSEEASYGFLLYSDEDNYYVAINFLGILTYRVRICTAKAVGDDQKNIYREQLIDATHLSYDCSTLLKKIDGNIINSRNELDINMSRNLLFLNDVNQLISTLENKNLKESSKEELLKVSEKNLYEVLGKQILHLRNIKRFAENLIIENGKLNLQKIRFDQQPLIYAVYKLGKDKVSISDDSVLRDKVRYYLNIDTRKEMEVFNEQNLKTFFEEINSDDDAIKHIKRGKDEIIKLSL